MINRLIAKLPQRKGTTSAVTRNTKDNYFINNLIFCIYGTN